MNQERISEMYVHVRQMKTDFSVQKQLYVSYILNKKSFKSSNEFVTLVSHFLRLGKRETPLLDASLPWLRDAVSGVVVRRAVT